MDEFRRTKACHVNIIPSRAPIREVIWSPPICPWRASVKNLVKTSYGGIFRNQDGRFLGCFSQYLGEGNVLYAEFNAAMTAIELAASKGYWNVWLETDS